MLFYKTNSGISIISFCKLCGAQFQYLCLNSGLILKVGGTPRSFGQGFCTGKVPEVQDKQASMEPGLQSGINEASFLDSIRLRPSSWLADQAKLRGQDFQERKLRPTRRLQHSAVTGMEAEVPKEAASFPSVQVSLW